MTIDVDAPAPLPLAVAIRDLRIATNAIIVTAQQIALQERFVAQQWAVAYQGAYDAERSASGRRDLAEASVATVRHELTRLKGEMVGLRARQHLLTVEIHALTHSPLIAIED